MDVLPACISLYARLVAREARDGIGSPGTRITDGCEMDVGAGIEPEPPNC